MVWMQLNSPKQRRTEQLVFSSKGQVALKEAKIVWASVELLSYWVIPVSDESNTLHLEKISLLYTPRYIGLFYYTYCPEKASLFLDGERILRARQFFARFIHRSSNNSNGATIYNGMGKSVLFLIDYKGIRLNTRPYTNLT